MFPKAHFLMNLPICIVLLFYINPIYVLLIFLSSILIDADHYLYYIYEQRDLSLKKAYNWCTMNKDKIRKLSPEKRHGFYNFIFIFHGIEVLLIVLILSRFYYPIFFIFIGLLIHFIEDIPESICFSFFRKKLFLSYAIYKHFKHDISKTIRNI